MTSREQDGTLIVTFEVASGWQQWILLTSDRHWDSTHSDRAMQKRHLDEARACNALVVDIGDWFDAMQARDDRRGDKSSLRPEFQRADYFTALTEAATEWFAPYADLFLLIGTGNHEQAVMRHQEINLSRHLVRALNARGGDIHAGSYAGWVKFQFIRDRKYLTPVWVYYHHGSGGSAPVSRGVIQTNRRAVYLPDANVVLSGHIHQQWMVPITRERISTRGVPYRDEQMHVQLPSYKDTFPIRAGYEAEKGFAPTPKGAVWWRLRYDREEIISDFTLAR